MRRIVSALLLLVSVWSAAAGPRIINGVRTTGYPSVGALMRGDSVETADLRCSGTLIGCSTFLTAAHCVCDLLRPDQCDVGEPGAPDPGRFWVFLPHGGIHEVAGFDIHPDFDFPLGGDLALVHLATPATGIVPTPINLSATVVPGAQGTIVGYGRSVGSDYFGLKREGRIQTARCASGVPNTTSVCWDYAEPIGPPGLDSDTCNGDSGGPLFVDFGCGRTVAGVTSGGYAEQKCVPPSHGFDTAVYQARDWISAHAGGDLGGNSCGALRPVGTPETVVETFEAEVRASAPDQLHEFTVAPGVEVLRVTVNSETYQNRAPMRVAVRAGAPPTATEFDCEHGGEASPYVACTFPNPTAGSWYVVTAYGGTSQSVTYQVTATAFAAGTPDPLGGTDGLACEDRNVCTGAATCAGGQCVGPAVADGSACADLSLCTYDDACVAGECRGSDTPEPGCRVPARGSSQLNYKPHPRDASRQLLWKWKANGGTFPSDFGSPGTVTPYELCIFDTSAGVPRLAHRSHVSPGPKWRATNSGWTYTDKLGLADGTTSLTLRASTTGRATLSYKAKGYAVHRPGTPWAVDPLLRAQLKSDAVCWEAGYTGLVSFSKAKVKY